MNYLADEYARVLFELGISNEACEDFVSKLDKCPELYEVLSSPAIAAEHKHRVIDKVFNKEICAFVRCLCDNSRAELYKDIYKAYRSLVISSNDLIEADFVCKDIPSDEELDSIKAMLAKKYNKKGALLDVIQDDTILGGFILKVGDTEYDKSYSGALKALKRRLDRR